MSPDPYPAPPPTQSRSPWWRTLVFHVFLPAAALLAGWWGTVHLLETAPTSRRKSRPRAALAVEVVRVHSGPAVPRLEGMGVVRPSREVRVRALVTGEVVGMTDRRQPGTRFAAGDDLIAIDRANYAFALAMATAERDQVAAAVAQAAASHAEATAVVAQRHAVLKSAEAQRRIEEGNQAVARREYEMMDAERRGASADLVLRQPQLQMARAAVAAAQAGEAAARAKVEEAKAALDAVRARARTAQIRVEEAELAITRTSITVPFNAWLRELHVNIGAVLTTQTDVATLVGTDAYWIEVVLPTRDLPWIPPIGGPDDECPDVAVRNENAWPPGVVRTGRLLQMLGDLEPEGRMARLLVQVDDPLELAKGPAARDLLLSGSYVHVTIDGRVLDDVVALDRAWLRHGDVVWVANEEGRLAIRNVAIRWSGRSEVYVSAGLVDGDRVVCTDIPAPVAGMPLRVKKVSIASAAR